MTRKMDYCLNLRDSLGNTGYELYPLRMARQAIHSFHYIQAAIYDSNEDIFVSRRFLRISILTKTVREPREFS